MTGNNGRSVHCYIDRDLASNLDQFADDHGLNVTALIASFGAQLADHNGTIPIDKLVTDARRYAAAKRRRGRGRQPEEAV